MKRDRSPRPLLIAELRNVGRRVERALQLIAGPHLKNLDISFEVQTSLEEFSAFDGLEVSPQHKVLSYADGDLYVEETISHS